MKKSLLISLCLIPLIGFSQLIIFKKNTTPRPIKEISSGGSKYMGKITDNETGEPLPFVNITLEENGVQISSTQSDFDGNFSIHGLPTGDFTARFSFIGLEDHEHTFNVYNKIKYFYDCKIQTNPTQLEKLGTLQKTVVSGLSGIKVKILDSKDREPLPFANFILQRNGVLVSGAQSDFDGNLYFKDIPPGDYIIKGTYLGYESLKHLITLKTETIVFVELPMKPCNIEIYGDIIKQSLKEDSVILKDLFSEQDRLDNSLLETSPSSVTDWGVSKIRTFPNPATEFITISELQNVQELEIIHISGQVIKNIPYIDSPEMRVDLTTFRTGIYFIRYQINDQFHIHKFLKH